LKVLKQALHVIFKKQIHFEIYYRYKIYKGQDPAPNDLKSGIRTKIFQLCITACKGYTRFAVILLTYTQRYDIGNDEDDTCKALQKCLKQKLCN
jgi:hypothetical protein